MSAWVGIDLDGTLAHYDHWRGIEYIGQPVPRMVRRVCKMLALGIDVRVFTARLTNSGAEWYVRQWCREHIGRELPVTDRKDMWCVRIYDDRAVRVEVNTGRLL